MRNGQAAMEFLMTYGWALLVVLAAIGALAYFGILAPDKFLPEKCTLIPGMACLDFKVTSSEATVLISNSLGRDITVTRVAVGNCSESFTQEMSNGEQVQFSMTGCDNGESGSRFKEDITIDYIQADSSFDKTARGSITCKIQ